jgi:8-oxo-dGTP diphosphatase
MISLQPAAIAIILNVEQRKVLLVKRRDVPVWVLPGGGVEPHETAEEAVIREVQEETGFLVAIVRPCAYYYPVNRLASVTSVFICQIQGGFADPSSEVGDMAFYSLDHLPSTLFYLHTNWLNEALTASQLISRPLTEISYWALSQYFLRHPWLVCRYAWTRFIN